VAEAEGVTRSFVNRLLRLTLLAPDIVEAILDGRQPKGLQLEQLIQMMPSAWEEQRSALLRGATDPGCLRRGGMQSKHWLAKLGVRERARLGSVMHLMRLRPSMRGDIPGLNHKML
jgi:hypothetical protein